MIIATQRSLQNKPEFVSKKPLTVRGFNPSHPPVSNKDLAKQFFSMADLLTQQNADHWRIYAYRQGAQALLDLDKSAQSIYLDNGIDGLIALSHIGKGIAAAIVEILQTGHWSQLERLRGRLDPVRLFTQVPGIGSGLAQRIIDQLDIDNFEGLESAAHDGRLARVRGIGLKRLDEIKAGLSDRLRPRTRKTRTQYPTAQDQHHPTVEQLLSVDAEYRRKSNAGSLDTIAPKRMNPDRIAWLPILHARRDEWYVTALFSNTDRAHAMRKTRDWVILYFHTDHQQPEHYHEGQFTVVTEIRGPLCGKRVIRGLEKDCTDYYKKCEKKKTA